MKLPPIPEFLLQKQVATVLDDYLRPDWRWTHIPNGELRDKKTAAKLKAMGVKRGWPDCLLLGPPGLYMLELKRKGERLTVDQEDLKTFCDLLGITYAMADTFERALEYLTEWECLRVKIK